MEKERILLMPSLPARYRYFIPTSRYAFFRNCRDISPPMVSDRSSPIPIPVRLPPIRGTIRFKSPSAEYLSPINERARVVFPISLLKNPSIERPSPIMDLVVMPKERLSLNTRMPTVEENLSEPETFS